MLLASAAKFHRLGELKNHTVSRTHSSTYSVPHGYKIMLIEFPKYRRKNTKADLFLSQGQLQWHLAGNSVTIHSLVPSSNALSTEFSSISYSCDVFSCGETTLLISKPGFMPSFLYSTVRKTLSETSPGATILSP